MNPLFESVSEAIGQTPLVSLNRITSDLDGRILAKLEYLNPGFSKKDRIARQMIEDAKSDGSLRPNQTVVELTSGNTGTGLAIVCAINDHPFVAVMSRGNSSERAKMMRALGAEVVLVDQLLGATPGQVSGGDLEHVERATQRITQERGAFRADQFQLQSSFRAHFLHTGPEIWSQADGMIDGFCDFIGSGGTFAGCAAVFKERNPDIQCFAIEPQGVEALAGKNVSNPNHRIQGGGYAMPDLRLINRKHIDDYLQVTDDEAIHYARRLAREEGIFGGFSSGANLAAACHLLRGPLKGKTIVIIICDSGLKYLSTDLWG